MKSKLFLPIRPFINSFWKIRVLGIFLNILCIFMSKADLTLAFCAAIGSKYFGDDDLSVVFYTFFVLRKNMKNSLLESSLSSFLTL